MTSGALLLINIGVIALVDGLLIYACVLAWRKGRPAERLGATLYFISALISLGLNIANRTPPVVPEMFFEGLVAVGFLLLALRYNSLWLGAAMMFKGVQLALHTIHLTDEVDPRIGPFDLYAVSLNLVSVMISLTILSGTIASIRARRRLGSEGSAQADGALEGAPPQAA